MKKAQRMDGLHDLVGQTASLLMSLGSDLYFTGACSSIGRDIHYVEMRAALLNPSRRKPG